MRRFALFVAAMVCLGMLLMLPTQHPSATVPSPTPVRTAKPRPTFMTSSQLKAYLDKMTHNGKAVQLDLVPLGDDDQVWAYPHQNGSRVEIANGIPLIVPWLGNDRLDDLDEYAPLPPGQLPPARSTRSYVSDYGEVEGYGQVKVVFQFAGTGVTNPDNPAAWNFHRIVIMTSNPPSVLYTNSQVSP